MKNIKDKYFQRRKQVRALFKDLRINLSNKKLNCYELRKNK